MRYSQIQAAGKTTFRAYVVILGCLVLLVGTTMLPKAASAQDRISSPIFTTYNTFLDINNFLELSATDDGNATISLSVFRIDGTLLKKLPPFTLKKLEQRDIDINQIVDQEDTYGVVKIEFNDSSSQVRGRMAFYRPDPENTGEFSFAFAREAREALTGTSYSIANSFDPLGRGFLVPVWAELTNLDSVARTFTHRTYDIAGNVVRSTMVTLQPNQRTDLNAGHDLGESVYLSEFVPADPAAIYLATVSRYGLNENFSANEPEYAFAVPVDAQTGITTTSYVPITREDVDCYVQTNWVEIANLASATNTIDITFRKEDGKRIAIDTMDIAPKAQFHFNAGEILRVKNAVSGQAIITSSIADSLFVQSAVYFEDCEDNDIQSAYVLPAVGGKRTPIVGSYNRFLEFENRLITINLRGSTRTVNHQLRVFTEPDALFDQDFQLAPFATAIFNLNDEMFNTMEDTFGTIQLDSPGADRSVAAYNVRIRFTTDGRKVDIAVPVAVN